MCPVVCAERGYVFLWSGRIRDRGRVDISAFMFSGARSHATRFRTTKSTEDDALVAMASLAEAVGVDMRGLQELVAGAQELMAKISR